MLELAQGDYRLMLEPEHGGSIARFDWRGEPVLRPSCGPSILDAASFPLVPFSNRIAHGRFRLGETEVTLAPNFPGSDHPHPLHGFGWLDTWTVTIADAAAAQLVHSHPGGQWPWPYRAEQRFELGAEGLLMALSVTNLGDSQMPVGLGFHPYFPRDGQTFFRGLHYGEWLTAEDGLPLRLREAEVACDWWAGQPVDARVVDTVYSGREGALTIIRANQGLAITLQPSSDLPFTVVYTPEDADFFCVEPVSHSTDAFNDSNSRTGYRVLAPGQTMAVSVQLSCSPLADEELNAILASGH